MQRFINTAFKAPQFFFSTVAKKKQMELTLRTPYRNSFLTQKPFSANSQAFLVLLLNPNNHQLLFKIVHLVPFTFSPLDP